MTFKFEISKDEYIGLIVIEYLNEKPNCVWELDYIKNKINMIKNDDISHYKHSVVRCINWLIDNHSELLL